VLKHDVGLFFLKNIFVMHFLKTALKCVTCVMILHPFFDFAEGSGHPRAMPTVHRALHTAHCTLYTAQPKEKNLGS